ncbi:unnamed protein product [Rhodiola kirilowii]
MMVIGVAEGSKASFRAGVKYEIHHTLGNGPVERTLIKVLIFGLGEHNGHIPMFAQMEHDEFEFFFFRTKYYTLIRQLEFRSGA